MCLGDALDDRQSEPDAGVVGAYPLGTTLKRLRQGGDELWGEHRPGALDPECHRLGLGAGRDPHRAVSRQIVDDPVAHQVGRQLEKKRLRADSGGHVSGGLESDVTFLGEGEKRLCHLLRNQGQVDAFGSEGPLVGAAEHEQRFGEVDRSGIDEQEAVDELVAGAIRAASGDLEQSLRDRERGSQFVGGVGREPLLFGDVRFQLRQHGVEGVGELVELVIAAGHPDPMRERSARGRPRGVGDPSEGSEHPASQKPPSDDAEDEETRQNDGCGRSEIAQESATAGRLEDLRAVDDDGLSSGHVPQQEQPHGRQQQRAGEHDEAGIADGELEADTGTGGPIHVRRPGARWPLRR